MKPVYFKLITQLTDAAKEPSTGVSEAFYYAVCHATGALDPGEHDLGPAVAYLSALIKPALERLSNDVEAHQERLRAEREAKDKADGEAEQLAYEQRQADLETLRAQEAEQSMRDTQAHLAVQDELARKRLTQAEELEQLQAGRAESVTQAEKVELNETYGQEAAETERHEQRDSVHPPEDLDREPGAQ